MNKNKLIDKAIKKYQETNDKKYFELIIKIYNPAKYKSSWNKKYGYLFDDFDSEYWYCFVRACQKYKVGLNNYFNKYFFSVLQMHFINQIKKISSQKRNPEEKCPICNEFVAPLSSHILLKHEDFIEKIIKKYHKNSTKCILCSYENDNIEQLIKHMRSEHASFILEEFSKEYPEYDLSLINKIDSINYSNDNNKEINTTERNDVNSISINESNINNIYSILKNFNLSECHKTILYFFIIDGNKKILRKNEICQVCKSIRNTNLCPLKKEMTNDDYKKIIDDISELI